MDPKNKESRTTNFQSIPGANVIINQLLNIPKSMASFKTLIEKEEFLLYSLPLFYLLPGIKENETKEVTISEYCMEQFKDAYLIQQSKLSSLKRKFRDFAIISFLQYKIFPSLLENAKINTLTPQESKNLESQIKEINDFLSGKKPLDPEQIIQKGGMKTSNWFSWLVVANVFIQGTGMATTANINEITEIPVNDDNGLITTANINGTNTNVYSFLSGNTTDSLHSLSDQTEFQSLETLEIDPNAYDGDVAGTPTANPGTSNEDDIVREMAEEAAAEAAEEDEQFKFTEDTASTTVQNLVLNRHELKEGWSNSTAFINNLRLQNTAQKATYTFDLTPVKADIIVSRFFQISDDKNVTDGDKAFYTELIGNIPQAELDIVIKSLLRYPEILGIKELVGRNILTYNRKGELEDKQITEKMLAQSIRFFGSNSLMDIGSTDNQKKFNKLQFILNRLDSKTNKELTDKFGKIQELMTSVEDAFTAIGKDNIDNLMTMFFQIGDNISLIEGDESRFIDNWIMEIKDLMYQKFIDSPKLKELFDGFLDENKKFTEQIKMYELATVNPVVADDDKGIAAPIQGLEMVLNPKEVGELGSYVNSISFQPSSQLTAEKQTELELKHRSNALMIGLGKMQVASIIDGTITEEQEKMMDAKIVDDIKQQQTYALELQDTYKQQTVELEDLNQKGKDLKAKAVEEGETSYFSVETQKGVLGSFTGQSDLVKELEKTEADIIKKEGQLQATAGKLAIVQDVLLPQLVITQIKKNYDGSKEIISDYKALQFSKFKDLWLASKIGFEKPDIVNFHVSTVQSVSDTGISSKPILTIQYAQDDFKIKRESIQLKKISLRAYKKILEYGKNNIVNLKDDELGESTWFQALGLSDTDKQQAVVEINTKIEAVVLSLEKLTLASDELTHLETDINLVTVTTIPSSGFDHSVPHNSDSLELLYDTNKFEHISKQMFIFNSTLSQIQNMKKPGELNEAFLNRFKEQANEEWSIWFKDWDISIMETLGKIALVDLGLGEWIRSSATALTQLGVVVLALAGLWFGGPLIRLGTNIVESTFSATKTASRWISNTSYTLILISAQLNGKNLSTKEIVIKFGTRVVFTGGVVYLYQSIGMGESISYLQYLSYAYSSIAILSGIPSMMGFSGKGLITTRNLSELKLIQSVSKNFSQYLTTQGVIDNFNLLTKERQLQLMTAWFGTPFYNNQVALLKDVPAESIIKSPIVDNVELFVDQVDAGNMILRINWWSQGLIAYQFVSLIDNMLESRGAYRRITSYLTTDGATATSVKSDERLAISSDPVAETDKEQTATPITPIPLDEREGISSVAGFTNDEITGQDGIPLTSPDSSEIQIQEHTAAVEEEQEHPAANPNAADSTTVRDVASDDEEQEDIYPFVEDAGGVSAPGHAEKKTNYIDTMKKYIDNAGDNCNAKTKKANLKELKAKDPVNRQLQNLSEAKEDVIDSTNKALRLLFDGKKLTPLRGGKKKNGSKKKKNAKKKGRKTKRKMYTKKKKGNSKKHKKKSKVKRNTRRK